MRVVGGIYKGRTLNEFKGSDIRPTSDMVRESLFNILREKIQNAYFLDLFCGSGAVGIEALSRGATFVQFNDASKKSVELTKLNLEKIKAERNCAVSLSDAITFLKSTDKKFDIIFIDAPYADQVGQDCIGFCKNALSDGGIIVYENELAFSGNVIGLKVYDQRKYGRACLTFFRSEE